MCLINPKSFEAETFSILFRVSESMRNKSRGGSKNHKPKGVVKAQGCYIVTCL